MYKRSFLHRNFKMPSKQTGRQIDISRCPYSLLNFCWMVNAKCSFLSMLFDLNCQNPLGLCNFVAFFSVLYSFSVPLVVVRIKKFNWNWERAIFGWNPTNFCLLLSGKKRNETTCKRRKKQQTYYLSTRSRCFSWDRHYVYATNCTPKTHISILFLFSFQLFILCLSLYVFFSLPFARSPFFCARIAAGRHNAHADALHCIWWCSTNPQYQRHHHHHRH